MSELETYKRLLRLLQKEGKNMPKQQRHSLVKSIVSLEKRICNLIVKQFLTGAITLNISKLPPRIQKLAQRLLNRRLHIIHNLEREKQQSLKLFQEQQKTISQISLGLMKQNNVGNLTPLEKLNSTQNQNSKKHKQNLQTIQDLFFTP